MGGLESILADRGEEHACLWSTEKTHTSSGEEANSVESLCHEDSPCPFPILVCHYRPYWCNVKAHFNTVCHYERISVSGLRKDFVKHFQK